MNEKPIYSKIKLPQVARKTYNYPHQSEWEKQLKCEHDCIKLSSSQKIWFFLITFAKKHEEYLICKKCGKRFD